MCISHLFYVFSKRDNNLPMILGKSIKDVKNYEMQRFQRIILLKYMYHEIK